MDKKRLIIYPLLFLVIFALASQGFSQMGQDGLVIPLLVTFVYFTLIFLVATKIKNNSIVDIGWGMGFAIGSWVTLATTEQPTLLSYVIVAFVSIWGIRLSLRLLKRNYGKPEDFRYAQWRKEWGDQVVLVAFFRVFLVQGLINFVVGSVSYSMIKFNQFSPEDLSYIYLLALGLLIAFIGLFFEVVGDEQLRRHIQKGTKTLLQTGLWSVTRHPNYLGEILIWCGLYIGGFSLVLRGSLSLLFYAILILSPLVMSTVLIKVSTPLLEKNMEKYKGWEDYCQRVPMLFPFTKASK